MTIRRVFDGKGRDVLYGTPDENPFVMERDGKYDEIRRFEDGVDRINLQAFDITFASLMIRQVSLLEYVVYVRDEELTVRMNRPAPEDIPADGMLLTADDFIFERGLADPPLQVIFETSSTRREVLTSTTLPDVFIFQDDGVRDVIARFEDGKDRIDLKSYNISFGDLVLTSNVDGRVGVRIRTGDGPDYLVVNDISGQMTVNDLTADDFIF